LHVVFPNTTAAKESGQDANDGAERPAKLNKTSSTLLEKLKADFNHSSKSAPDRVAQIRLSTNHLQSSKPGTKLSQEQREEWDDVVSKLKALILASFDLRVGQYEEDIREKDSQRILPGWNFCTFFVLKEGLARGFESVGLIDDALAGYEELNTELDIILSSDGEELADMFPPYTEELKTLYVDAHEQSSSFAATWDGQNKPISATRKNFRELILANNISKFDFKVYVLARKMAVLLRMSRTPEKAENLVPLGQLCQMGASDIPSISRIIAQDIRAR
jgi:trafficking protein particle complex subunit 10